MSPPGARCSVAASQDRPLIIEWDAAARNDLDALLKQDGVVVVRYSGCEMELLRDCRAPGSYKYMAATRQDEAVYLRDADELWAKLPLGAATLEGTLHNGQQLRIDMSVIGKYVGDQAIMDLARFRGADCAGATHVVTGLTAGAFEMLSGSASSIGMSAVVAGGSSSSSVETLRRSGNRAACDKATRADAQPPEGCGAFLRLELAPVQCPAGARYEAGKGCVGDQAAPVVNLGGPGGQTDPLDVASGRLILDAAQAVLASAQGKDPPRNMTVEFKQPFEQARKPFQTMGPATEYLLSTCEIGFRRVEPGHEESLIVYADMQVHIDGQLRWGNLGAFAVKESVETAVPMDQAPKPLVDLHQHLLRALTHEACRPTPAIARTDWSYLRGSIDRLMDDGDLPNEKDAAETCAKASAFSGSWRVEPFECQVAFGTPTKYGITKIHIVPKPDGAFLVKANVWEEIEERD